MEKWTKTWPEEEGTYWFYGWSNAYNMNNGREVKLKLVNVRKISNGMLYLVGSEFLRSSEGAYGMWLKTDLPECPDIKPLTVE